MSITELCVAVSAAAGVVAASVSLWGLRAHGRSLRRSGILFREALSIYGQVDALVEHRAHLDVRGAALEHVLRNRAVALQVEALSFTEVITKSSVYVRLRETSLVLCFVAAYLFPLLCLWTGLGRVQVPDWVSWLVTAGWFVALVGSAMGLLLYASFRLDVIDTARRAFVECPEHGAPRTYLQANDAKELRTLLRADQVRHRLDNEALGVPSRFATCVEFVYGVTSAPAWIAAYMSRVPTDAARRVGALLARSRA